MKNYLIPIYRYAKKVQKSIWKYNKKIGFKSFKYKNGLGAMDILEKFPERANYFSEPTRSVFDWHLNYKLWSYSWWF